MDNVKFILVSIITLALLGLVGYFAFGTLQSGSEHKQDQEIRRLEEENEGLKEQLSTLTEELSQFQTEVAEVETQPEAEQPAAPKPEVVKPVTTTKTAYKYQTLINELQELVDDNIYMKLKSKGSRVGTLQEFLNLYNKTSNKIDNDFGASTKTALITFQKKVGITADGEAGPSTYKKMIEWLKKQG